MSTTEKHYEDLLAPIYIWMMGGIESALALGAQEVQSLLPGKGKAVDLGAGFGMHAIPLAQGGYEVSAVDSSATLLNTLKAHANGLPIRTHMADLRDFQNLLQAPVPLILCLGDTLTHLEEQEDVHDLVSDVANSLNAGGRFVTTFRDYCRPNAAGVHLVQSDPHRILTCLLEDRGEKMLVHDIVHELDGKRWSMRASSYPKLKLQPQRLVQLLKEAGLEASLSAGTRGMVRIEATRAA